MKMKYLRKVLVFAFACMLILAICACEGAAGEGTLVIHSDGTGNRKISVYLPKDDGDSSTYSYLYKHGADLESYLEMVYAEKVPGSDVWLDVIVDDSGAEDEYITLSFDFTSFDEYITRLRALAYDDTQTVFWEDPEISVVNGEIVGYAESREVIMAVLRSICNTMKQDSTLYNSFVKDYDWVNDIGNETEECFFVTVDDEQMVGAIADSTGKFRWYAEGYQSNEILFEATLAEEWTDIFSRYNEDEITWLGADGIFSFALDGNDAFASATDSTRTFFIFSDTRVGTAENGEVVGKSYMPNHSAALLSGNIADAEDIEFVWGLNGSNTTEPTELKNTQLKNLFGSYKWIRDGLVLNDNLYLFGFTPVNLMMENIDLITVPIRDGEPVWEEYSITEKIEQLFYEDESMQVEFGTAVHVNTEEAGAPNPDGYVYIYGRWKKDRNSSGADCYLVASRIKESDFPDFSKLQYWNGEEWTADITEIAKIIPNVSSEMSVSPITVGPYAGKYIAVYIEGDISGKLMYAIGDSPVGPFDLRVNFYNAPENDKEVIDYDGETTSIMTYNAKAHPHLSSGDKLLVSYNMNVYTGKNSPSNYHPIFLWLDLEPRESYEYTVEYYYDGVKDETKTEVGNAVCGSVISTYVDKAEDGYVLDKVEGLDLTIGSDASANVIRVYYKTQPSSDTGSGSEGESGTGSGEGSGNEGESGSGSEGESGTGSGDESGSGTGSGDESGSGTGSGDESGSGTGEDSKVETVTGTVINTEMATSTENVKNVGTENSVTSPKTGDIKMPGNIMAMLILGGILVIGGIVVGTISYKKHM